MFGRNSILRSWFLQFTVTVVLITSMNLSALPPSWWHESDSAGRKVIDPAVTVPNHFGPANIGQAKYMARRALEALRSRVPAVANDIEADLVGPGKIIPSWEVPVAGTDLAKDQYSPLQIGQLKAIADPFYRRLNTFNSVWLENQLQANLTKDPANSAHYFPWTHSPADDQNSAIATLGQLKAVFSLHFESLVNPNVVLNNGNMARLSVVGKLLVRVTTATGTAVQGANLQFTRLSGNGSFPGGVTDTNRVTNSAGEVSAADYNSPEGDLIRVSLHTSQGTQNVWLPANVSLLEHIVRTGSGGFAYNPPGYLQAGGVEPEVHPQPDSPEDPNGPSPQVGRFVSYLDYTALWTETTVIPGQTTVSQKTLQWSPLSGIRTVGQISYITVNGVTTTHPGETLYWADIITDSPSRGFEINAYKAFSDTSASNATAQMTINTQLPLGYNKIDVEHAYMWSRTPGFARGVAARQKLTLASSPVVIATPPDFIGGPSGAVTSAIGPFISRGPTAMEGYDNNVSWREIAANTINIRRDDTKSLRAEVIVDGAGCSNALSSTHWEVESSNWDVLVSIYGLDAYVAYGEVPVSTKFSAPNASARETEIRLKSRNNLGNARSKITLSLVDSDGRVVVQKEFNVAVDGGSEDTDPPRYGEGVLTKTMTNDESTGPKYRKIALDGRPLADEKPQGAAETDEEDEETYVDALTRELRHSTTDIYVPVPGSDLALTVRRNIVSEIWNPTSGLCPHEDPTFAFGPVWRTNLASNITIVEQIDGTPGGPSNGDHELTGMAGLVAKLSKTQRLDKGLVQTDPNYAFVTDEDGASHRFMIGYLWAGGGGVSSRYFVPAPTSKNEKAAHEVSLVHGAQGQLVFKKKHGNELVFESCIGFKIDRVRMAGIGPNNGTTDGGDLSNSASEWGGGVSSLVLDNDHIVGTKGSGQYQAYNYYRLASVTDRLGTKLEYQYAPGGDDMVPVSIKVAGRPELAIHVNSIGGRIQTVSDPKGNQTVYHYNSNGTLQKATVDGTPTASYGYKRWEETDPKKNVTSSDGQTLMSWARKTPVAGDPELDESVLYQYGEKVQHFDLSSISDAAENTHSFIYRADHSHKVTSVSSFAGLATGVDQFTSRLEDAGPCGQTYALSGYPPDVTHINLPGGGQVRIGDSSEIPPVLGGGGQYFDSGKHTTVMDAENHRRTYAWEGQVSVRVDQEALGYQQEFSWGTPAKLSDLVAGDVTNVPLTNGSGSTATHTFYTKMSIRHDAGGVETYTFNYLAGGALESVRDFSGNLTQFGYGQIEGDTSVQVLGTLLPGGITAPLSPKPTSQTDAAWRTTWFSYGAKEMMTRNFNAGTTLAREFGVDEWGRSTRETIKSIDSTILGETEIHHHSDPGTGFPGFVVRKTVKNTGALSLADDPAWVQPLTTLYEPDSLGRVGREASDLNGDNLIGAGDLITTYTYDRNGNKLSATDSAGNTTWFHYDKRNRLVDVVHPDGTEKKSVYDSRGKKVLEYDEKGIATGYVYDSRGRMTKSVRDMNGNLSQTVNGLVGVDAGIDLIEERVYNKVGSVTQVKDARGYISVTEYDHLQRPVKAISPGSTRAPGQVPNSRASDEMTEFYYDGDNPGASCFDVSGFKPTRIVDPRGYSSLFIYDNLYRCTESRSQYSLAPHYAQKVNYYDSESGILSEVHEPRQPVNDLGNAVGPSIPGMRKTVNSYDELLRPVKVVDHDSVDSSKSGETKTFYTTTGLVWKTERKLAINKYAETQTEYDRAGRVTKVISPEVFLDGTTTPVKPQVSTVYGPSGLAIESVDPQGAITRFVHDARGRLIQQISPLVLDHDSQTQLSPVSTTSYDQVGNVIKVTDPLGHSTVTEYDPAHRPFKVKAPTYWDSMTSQEVAPVTTSVYDAGGNVTSVTDPNGSVTINTYDARGRLTQTKTNPIVPASSTSHAQDMMTGFSWDKAGNRTRVVDAAGQHTSFEYDGLNRLTATIWDSNDVARAKTEISEYDALVQISKTDPRGTKTEYQYNGRLLLTGSTCAQFAADNESRTYDLGGRLLSVTSAGDALRNVSYEYDALDRVTRETSAGDSHDYGYDPSGNRTKVTYGHTERVLNSEYDDLNRLSSITESKPGVPSERLTGYGYDLAGNVLERRQANGTTEVNAYYPQGRRKFQRTMTGTGTTPVSWFDYSYDPAGQVTRIKEAYASSTIPDRSLFNAYDRVGRLLTENADTLTSTQTVSKSVLTTYTYSKANSRTLKNVQLTEGGALVSSVDEGYTYGSSSNGKNSNQLHSHTKGGVTTVYTYDENGNRQTTTVNAALKETYGWDSKNRLISLVQVSPAKTFTYGYDYRMRRVIRDESAAGGDNTTVSFSGGTSVFEKVGSAIAVEFIRGSDYGGGIGGIMYSVRAGANLFNAYNSRGDVVAKSNAAGTVTWQATYEAFGTRTTETGTNPDRQKANTKEEDPTGLLNEGFRYRDLVTGSFISRDPLGFVDGPNVYTYVMQNPWTSFDPHGLFWFGQNVLNPNHPEPYGDNAAKNVAIFIGRIPGLFIQKFDQHIADPVSVAVIGKSAREVEVEVERKVEEISKPLGEEAQVAAAVVITVVELRKGKVDVDDIEDLAENVQKKTPWTSTERRRAWKDKGQADGKAPQREVIVENRKTGEIETRVESKELHHDEPRRNGGGNDDSNLQEVWPNEHEAIDPHRHTDYDVVTEIPDHAFTDE